MDVFLCRIQKEKKPYIKMQKMSNYYLLLFLHAFVLFLALKIKKNKYIKGYFTQMYSKALNIIR